MSSHQRYYMQCADKAHVKLPMLVAAHVQGSVYRTASPQNTSDVVPVSRLCITVATTSWQLRLPLITSFILET